jgi:uncharacterized protein YjiS (DUF1127 family)
MTFTLYQARVRAAAISRHQPALDALSEAGAWVFATLREWRRRIRSRQELARLDDRMLKDIGLSHAEREFLANKPFWRE